MPARSRADESCPRICFFEPHASYAAIAVSQKFIGSVLDPLGHADSGRSPMSGVVFEPAILRRVVRWNDDNAVRQMLSARAVIDKDGV